MGEREDITQREIDKRAHPQKVLKGNIVRENRRYKYCHKSRHMYYPFACGSISATVLVIHRNTPKRKKAPGANDITTQLVHPNGMTLMSRTVPKPRSSRIIATAISVYEYPIPFESASNTEWCTLFCI